MHTHECKNQKKRQVVGSDSGPLAHGSVVLGSNRTVAGGPAIQSPKTSDNIPEEDLTLRTQRGQGLRVTAVYVFNMRDESLMSTTPHRAKHLLKKGEAHVYSRTPFAIQMNHQTGEDKQPITLGMDAGSGIVGLSAITENKELFAGEFKLRNDITGLIADKRKFRRNRRNRLWYRVARWLNRTKPEGWLPPSVQHKLDSHVKLIQMSHEYLPISQTLIETQPFDIQKIKNPSIAGKEYQQGEQLGFENVRAYVLYRDGHKCRHCKGKSKCKKLHIHHKIPRSQNGTDLPENLVTLCEECHEKVHDGTIVLKDSKHPQMFRHETFMNILNARIFDELNKIGIHAERKYGYETKHRRKQMRLDKSHANDAFIIAGGSENYQRTNMQHRGKFVRKQNRKLFKGARSHVRNVAARIIHGFQRFDKVLYKEIECFIFGKRSTGYFEIRRLNGEKIHASVNWKKLELLESAKTFLMERVLVR